MRSVSIILLSLCAVLAPGAARSLHAQTTVSAPAVSDTIYDIRLRDGSRVYARLLEQDSQHVVVQSLTGTRMDIPRAQIKQMSVVRGRVVGGEIWNEDPNGTRLFFTSTARTLRRGDGYVGVFFFVLPFAAVGVTDRITLAGGAPILFGEIEPMWLAPKVQLFERGKLATAVGTLMFIFEGNDPIGIAYGVGTFGDRDQALTLGAGWGYSGEDFTNRPAVMVGFEQRTGNRTKVLTENYFIPGKTGAIFSGGIRFMGDRLSTDVGLSAFAGGDFAACCIPLLSFSYGLGGGR
jgi:hypothetical protein